MLFTLHSETSDKFQITINKNGKATTVLGAFALTEISIYPKLFIVKSFYLKTTRQKESGENVLSIIAAENFILQSKVIICP